MNADHRSFAGRAALAVALLLGFYVLALGVAGVLIAAVIVTAANGRVAYWFLPAALTAYAVLRGVFFIERGERSPTGIRVDARSQPRLLALVTEVAEAMRTKAPDEVFLIPDVNAFVYEQGRLLGLVRTKRIMGIGLALANVMKVDELRSVLAHEYGHYVGGDTRLGGMIYRARASITRTLSHLNAGFLRRIFLVYGEFFMRLTQQISREQELAADVSAARIGGREAHTSALRQVVGAGAAFDAFMEEFVVPLWQEKRYPDNLYAGFSSFLDDSERRDQIAGYVERVRDREDRYDSHPSLGRRLAQIAEGKEGAVPDRRAARELLVDPDSAERQMSRIVSGIAVPETRLSAISWEETADVRAARIRASADTFIDALGPDGIRIEGDRLPRVVLVLEKADANKIVRRLLPLREYPPEALEGIVDDTIHYYVAATMANDLIERHGYRMQLSWTKPFLLQAPDGAFVDVGERVGRALESRDLRSLLIRR
jgi:Zn-dependent protease with chaperone function